jgi:hypothetical protein
VRNHYLVAPAKGSLGKAKAEEAAQAEAEEGRRFFAELEGDTLRGLDKARRRAGLPPRKPHSNPRASSTAARGKSRKKVTLRKRVVESD